MIATRSCRCAFRRFFALRQSTADGPVYYSPVKKRVVLERDDGGKIVLYVPSPKHGLELHVLELGFSSLSRLL